jgi:hypothetical protein
MERINQYAYFELGGALARLTVHDGDVPRIDVWGDLWAAHREMRRLLNNKNALLEVSRKSAEVVAKRLTEIDETYFKEKNSDGKLVMRMPENDDEPIRSWHWDNLKSAVEAFKTVFSAEMAEATTYYVPRRGIFFTPALVDKADESFPESVRGYIPEKATADWRSAGRCLAFNLFSASGFHVARAVEATLEVYYQLYTGKSGTLNGWYDYIEALKKVVQSGDKPAPAAKTLAEISQMKDDYRNPVMHPRVSLTEADARMLFDNGESVIIAMAEEIKVIRDAGGTQTGLALMGGAQVTP